MQEQFQRRQHYLSQYVGVWLHDAFALLLVTIVHGSCQGRLDVSNGIFLQVSLSIFPFVSLRREELPRILPEYRMALAPVVRG